MWVTESDLHDEKYPVKLFAKVDEHVIVARSWGMPFQFTAVRKKSNAAKVALRDGVRAIE